MELQCIEFDRDEIPASKKIIVDGDLYSLEICYNKLYDFYTAHLYNSSDVLLVSTKIVNMGNIFSFKMEGIPDKILVALNISDLTSDFPEAIGVNYETFGKKVKLYLI